MRNLFIHCSLFASRDVEKVVKESFAEFEKETVSDQDVFILFTCIEEGDDNGTVSKAAGKTRSEFRKFKKESGQDPNKILVVPFAHLSRKLASPETATELLDRFVEKLKKETELEDIERLTFGTAKALKLSFLERTNSIGYIEL